MTSAHLPLFRSRFRLPFFSLIAPLRRLGGVGSLADVMYNTGCAHQTSFRWSIEQQFCKSPCLPCWEAAVHKFRWPESGHSPDELTGKQFETPAVAVLPDSCNSQRELLLLQPKYPQNLSVEWKSELSNVLKFLPCECNWKGSAENWQNKQNRKGTRGRDFLMFSVSRRNGCRKQKRFQCTQKNLNLSFKMLTF